MSEPAAEPTVEQPPTPSEPAGEPEPPQAFTQEQVNAILAEDRRKTGQKYGDYDQLKAKAEKFDKAQEAAKTAEERAADAARKAVEDAANARAETLRYKAAATHHVDPQHFDLLGTGTEDEVMDRAKRIGELIAAKAELDRVRTEQPPGGPTSTRPTLTPVPGASPVVIETTDNSYPAHWVTRG